MGSVDGPHIEADFSEKGGGGETSVRFFSWTRPVSYWDVVGSHFPAALVAGIALLLSSLVPLHLLPLKRCTFLGLMGYPCPFCGFTRSFWAMAKCDWAFAVYNCPLACLMYIMIVLFFAWNLMGMLVGIKIVRGRFLRLKVGHGRWAIGLVCVLFILNWAYRLAIGLK